MIVVECDGHYREKRDEQASGSHPGYRRSSIRSYSAATAAEYHSASIALTFSWERCRSSLHSSSPPVHSLSPEHDSLRAHEALSPPTLHSRHLVPSHSGYSLCSHARRPRALVRRLLAAGVQPRCQRQTLPRSARVNLLCTWRGSISNRGS